MDEVTKRSSVPSAASVCTSVMRACPPILSAASAPGMRSDPGKSPADTTGAGSSGVRCGSWLRPGRLCGERGRGRGAPCQRCQLCLRRKSHGARVVEPRAQRLELARLIVKATRLFLQQPALVIDETAQIGQRRIRRRLGVYRRKRRRDERRGDRDSDGARRVEMSHRGATRATRMPKRGSCRPGARGPPRAGTTMATSRGAMGSRDLVIALTACCDVAALRGARTLDGPYSTITSSCSRVHGSDWSGAVLAI